MLTKELLEREIYPLIFAQATTVFSELDLEPYRGGYRGSKGLFGRDTKQKRKDKVVITKAMPFVILEQGGESLNYWSYISRRDNLTTNRQILERLASLVNYELPKLDRETQARIEKAQKVASINQSINSYLLNQLPKSEEAKAYLNNKSEYYLKNSFVLEIGFLPSKQELRKHLLKQYQEQEVKEALATIPDIKNRISLPYRDSYGKIKGFSFRTITGEEPKYLYSKGEFRKNLLYNLTPIKQEREAIILESPIDAKLLSSFDEFSNYNVIALGGTSFNTEQAKLLKKRGFDKITLALDNDSAGKTATEKAVKELSRNGFNNIYFYKHSKTDLKDVGEIFEAKGIKPIIEGINEALSISNYCGLNVLQYIQDNKLEDNLTDRDKAPLTRFILEQVSLIVNRFELEEFYRKIEDNFSAIGITRETLSEEHENLQKALDQEKLKRKLLKLNRDLQEAISSGNIEKVKELQKASNNALIEAKTRDLTKLTEPLTENKLKQELSKASDSLKIGLRLRNNDYEEQEIELPSSSLSYVVAPTSHGKTMALVNFMLEAAINNPSKEFYFFVLEGTKESILLRFLNCYANMSLSSNVNNTKTLNRYFKSNNYDYLDSDIVEEFNEKKNEFFDNFINTNRLNFIDQYTTEIELIEAISYLSKNRNVGGIFIDYIQLVRSTQSKTSRQEELKQIGLDFLEIAKETTLPICFAAQFNRDVKGSQDMSPYKIGEAGDIERQASLIIGLFNKYKGGDSDDQELYLELLKNRGGNPVANGGFNFIGNTGKIILDKSE